MKRFAYCLILAGGVFTPLLATMSAQKTTAHVAQTKPAPQQEDGGQKVFEQNCARCHNAPEGFSPRISGTIVRHMRVRANLSKEDEQKLLRFFNP